MEIEDTRNGERTQLCPECLQGLRKLSQLQLDLLKYKVEADLDNYLLRLQNSKDTDMKTLLQYANSISFTANCPPNYAQEMIQNPYPSLIEIRASLLANKKSIEEKSYMDEKSVLSQRNETAKNDLNDMAMEDDDAITAADEEAMSVITQSLFHNDRHKSKKVSWDISDDDSYSDSSYTVSYKKTTQSYCIDLPLIS